MGGTGLSLAMIHAGEVPAHWSAIREAVGYDDFAGRLAGLLEYPDCQDP